MTDDYKPLAPAARILWGVQGVAAYLLLGLPLSAALFVVYGPVAGAVAVVVVLALALHWWWLSGRRYRSWGYAERDRDLLIRYGVLIRRTSVVPYGRMQLVDVTEGPISRMLGIATVQLHTAAATTDAVVPHLPVAEANRLREHLTQLGEANAAGL